MLKHHSERMENCIMYRQEPPACTDRLGSGCGGGKSELQIAGQAPGGGLRRACAAGVAKKRKEKQRQRGGHSN